MAATTHPLTPTYTHTLIIYADTQETDWVYACLHELALARADGTYIPPPRTDTLSIARLADELGMADTAARKISSEKYFLNHHLYMSACLY